MTNDGERTRVLIVSGRDPSGAGIDADLAAASEPWIEAIPIVTAETDQDASGVRSIGARDPRAWLEEARFAARTGVDAIKFGLLPGSDHVRAARDLVRELRSRAGRELPAVVDPVIVASSGGRFLDWAGVESFRRDLAACGVVLTPNLPEAAELASVALVQLIATPEARVAAARILVEMGAVGVVIKGGHGAEDPVLDLVLLTGGYVRWLEHPRIPATIRGSGCRFATRLAAELGRGRSLEESTAEAGRFVTSEIERTAEATSRSHA
jgi:hydroxymethylpyrimidine/phosphomethylpyrimidine kinase